MTDRWRRVVAKRPTGHDPSVGESASASLEGVVMNRELRRTGTEVTCPFCAEREELYVDWGGGTTQVYTEDCAVCCRPRVVHVEAGLTEGQVQVWLERGD